MIDVDKFNDLGIGKILPCQNVAGTRRRWENDCTTALDLKDEPDTKYWRKLAPTSTRISPREFMVPRQAPSAIQKPGPLGQLAVLQLHGRPTGSGQSKYSTNPTAPQASRQDKHACSTSCQ